MTAFVTRLAPSPTGALHLGNALAFLVNWALGRNQGWKVLLRIEDLDSPRVKADSAAAAIDLLRWMGIDWDGPILVQSADSTPYESTLKRLIESGYVYSCPLSRREIEAVASAPQDGSQVVPFPRTLRPEASREPGRFRFAGLNVNYRFITPEEPVEIEDRIVGRRAFDPQVDFGDFVIWTKRGVPAYQLAVVVDDSRQGVTDVVRGDDLLPSAAMQTLLYRAIGCEAPRWWHLPLVVGEDGRRLAKRHGDTRIDTYRAVGVPATRIVGLIAYWVGTSDRRREVDAAELRLSFDVARLPGSPIVFTREDHEWLLYASSPSSSSSRP